jgi:peroxiredoxin
MKKSLYITGLILPVLVAGLIVGVVYLRGDNASAIRDAATRLGVEVSSPPVVAKDFTLPDPHGKRISLRDFRGKTVMLNFWATWCGPCKEEMPSMEKLYQQFKGRGLVVLGVAVGEDSREVEAFMRDHRLTFATLIDGDDEATDAYNVWSIPMTFFINPEGRIVGKIHGYRLWDREEAVSYVSELL